MTLPLHKVKLASMLIRLSSNLNCERKSFLGYISCKGSTRKRAEDLLAVGVGR